MDDTERFLRHHLPAEGYKCVTTITGKRVRQTFFKNITEMTRFVLAEDARGVDVYFACASFRSMSRKAANVHSITIFWADVDCGEGKPYPDFRTADADLTRFLMETGMPQPTQVGSGNGLHLYWILVDPLNYAAWKGYAQAIHDLFERHGFRVDQVRTRDAASILRPPGTHNHKSEVRKPVTLLHLADPVDVFDLGLNRDANRDKSRQTTTNPDKSRQTTTNPDSLIGQIDLPFPDIPSDPHKIAEGCGQIRKMRDTLGVIPEPNWFLCLGLLKFAESGEAIAHEWSKGDSRYDPVETQGKMDRYTAPTRCDSFAALDPGPCGACPHRGKITTPLELGRFVQGTGTKNAESALKLSPESNVNSCFRNGPGGLFHVSEDKKGQESLTLISSCPIMLKAECLGEHATDNHSLLFEMTLPRQGTKTLDIPSGTLFSARGMPELARMGAIIHDADLFRQYVRETVDEHRRNHDSQTRFDQFGWKEDNTAFLFAEKLYRAGKVEPAAGSGEVQRRSKLLGPRGGSLKEWSAAANKLFAGGCEPQSFALLCAFAAPLMRFHVESEGGAIVNLISDASGTGKTTALEAAASVWGELDGLRLTDEDTKVSRGLTLGSLGNLPCVFDELHQRDPDYVREFVVVFTNGRDKLRGTSEGALRAPAGDWQTIMILGSNQSLVDIIRARNTEEAQAFRVMEFVAEASFGGYDGDRLRRQLKANAGHAGDAYLRYLLQPAVLQRVHTLLPETLELFWKNGFDRRHRFWVRTLACAAVAGSIVKQLGLLDFNVKRIIDWAITNCQARAEEDQENKRSYAQLLSECLYSLYAQTLITRDEWKPGRAHHCQVLKEPQGTLLARAVRDTGRVYVLKTAIRTWLVKNSINRTQFNKELEQAKIITHLQKLVTLGAGTELAIGGQVPCYEINLLHPAMSGALVEIKEMIPRSPAAASAPPSPPAPARSSP
jgi:hypothetical protein